MATIEAHAFENLSYFLTNLRVHHTIDTLKRASKKSIWVLHPNRKRHFPGMAVSQYTTSLCLEILEKINCMPDLDAPKNEVLDVCGGLYIRTPRK
jgi:hypothetical protein